MTSQVLTEQASAALDCWARLLRGHATLTRLVSSELREAHGLTINDYEALLVLSRAPRCAMRRVDLAERLLLTPSGVTRLLDGLEAAGLVEKGTCETDARVTYAVLTEQGRERLDAAAESHLAAVRQVLEGRFSEEELATLAGLLARLPDAADAAASQCRPGSGDQV
jgi:DNA-binding MarR family transcriptional regulator